MFKVIKDFADLQDNNHIYRKGDTYPREGLKVSLDRQAELMGTINRIGQPLIEEVDALPESATVVDLFDEEEKPVKKKNKNK